MSRAALDSPAIRPTCQQSIAVCRVYETADRRIGYKSLAGWHPLRPSFRSRAFRALRQAIALRTRHTDLAILGLFSEESTRAPLRVTCAFRRIINAQSVSPKSSSSVLVCRINVQVLCRHHRMQAHPPNSRFLRARLSLILPPPGFF